MRGYRIVEISKLSEGSADLRVCLKPCVSILSGCLLFHALPRAKLFLCFFTDRYAWGCCVWRRGGLCENIKQRMDLCVDGKITHWWWQALEAESGQDYRPHDQQGAGAAQSFNSMCQGTIACARVLMPGYYRAQQSTACSISDTWEMNSEPPEFTQ